MSDHSTLEELLIRANPVLDLEELRLPASEVDARCASILERSGAMQTQTPTRQPSGAPTPQRRWKPALVFAVSFLIVVLVVAGVVLLRSGDDPVVDEPTTTTVAPDESAFEIIPNERYHSGTAAEGWVEPLIDVYAPTAAGEDRQVVVVFPGGPGTSRKSSYAGLAAALAKRGAVVFVADWSGQRELAADPLEAYRWITTQMDAGACAVSYALVNAPTYGGNPDRLVLFGHSGGANAASVIGMRTPRPFDECAVDMRRFQADQIVLWEGDWLLESTDWDRWQDDLPQVRAAITPWDRLEVAYGNTWPRPSVLQVITGDAPDRCLDEPPEGWLQWRDPDGTFTTGLEAIGAFDDGCLDARDVAALLTNALRDTGWLAEELHLEDSSHEYLTPDNQATLLDAIAGTSTVTITVSDIRIPELLEEATPQIKLNAPRSVDGWNLWVGIRPLTDAQSASVYLGGFTAAMSGDPASVTETASRARPESRSRFPQFPDAFHPPSNAWVTGHELLLTPGRYAADLYLGQSGMGNLMNCYAWVGECWICSTTIDVEEGRDAALTITGGFEKWRWSGSEDDLPAPEYECTVAP